MIELSGVAVGDRLRLVGGITAEVLELVNDEWAKVRLVEVPDGEPGAEELCHATDVIGILYIVSRILSVPRYRRSIGPAAYRPALPSMSRARV